MKKYIFLTLILIGNSCSKDWLELKQPGNNQEVYFEDAATAFEAVVAAYDVQAWRENINALWAVGSVMSDDAVKGGESPGDQQGMFDCQNFAATPNTDVPFWIWRDLYKMVANASFAIDIMVEKDENNRFILGMDNDLRNRFIAECRFLRAYSYFRLVRNFGGVMLYTSREDDGTSHGEDIKSSLPRASVSEVYSQIEADLEFASSFLPDANGVFSQLNNFLYNSPETDEAQLGRATKGAAQGLLAKVYLYQRKFSQAKSQCELLMNSGIYALEDDYSDIFKSGQQWGKEVIWALHMTEDLDGNWWEHEGSWISIFFGDRDMGWGYGFNNPTQDFVDAFEVGDERKDASIVFDGESIPGTFSGVPHDFNGGSWNPETGYLCQKYLIPDNERPTTVDCNSNLDYIFLRFSDILLMHAEACMELYNSDPSWDMLTEEADPFLLGARKSISLVRKRAGLNSHGDYLIESIGSVDVDGNNTINNLDTLKVFCYYPRAKIINNYKETNLLQHEELRAVVYHERRVEFGLEHERFYDLVRWGDAGIVFQNFNDNGNDYGKNNFVVGCNELLPIPGDDVNNSGGLITQNPCY